MRLGLRLFLGFFLIVGVAAFFVMRVFVDEVKPGVRQAMESTLVDTANLLAVLARDDLQAGTIGDGAFARDVVEAQKRPIGANIWAFPKRSFEYRITVTDARGIVVFDSRGQDLGRDNSRWNDVARTLRGEYGARSSPETPGDTEHTVMHVAAPIRDGDRIIGVLTVSQPNRVIEPFIAASQRNILVRGTWLIGIAALIGLLATWWLARGIGRLNRYAQAVSAGEPVPPPEPRRDEIGDLGQAIEQMRRRLEGKAYVEQYVQSLTHEMKSPLAAIRGAAELLQEDLPDAERKRFAGHIAAQEARMTETIDQLLALSEVEQHGWLQSRGAVPVATLLDAAADDAAGRAAAAGVTLAVAVAAASARALGSVEGDAHLLRRALGNLVENAIDFAPRGSGVVLSAARGPGGVVVEVTDRGPGVPEYAAGRVFERFYSLPRPDGRPRSSGLGLPFVAEVMRLHGGSASLVAAADGGTVARMQFA